MPTRVEEAIKLRLGLDVTVEISGDSGQLRCVELRNGGTVRRQKLVSWATMLCLSAELFHRGYYGPARSEGENLLVG
jgi:hypothetical protein